MITSGGTTTLGLYDNASEIRKKADISYVDSMVWDFQAQVVSLAGGHMGYATLALATTASTGLPANTVVEVTNDTTTSNNGLYLWNGTTLTKSAYDPLTQAKEYVSKTGLAKVSAAAITNIDYTTANRTLTFKNTTYITSGTSVYPLTTPSDAEKTVSLPTNAVYRLEYNVLTNTIRAQVHSQALMDGWITVGIIRVSDTGILTEDFEYAINGVAYSPVSESTKAAAVDAASKVSVLKSELLVAGTNLYNAATATVGFAILNDGSISTNANYSYSDYIAVVPNQKYSMTAKSLSTGLVENAFIYTCYYDKDKNFISRASTQNITQPNGVLTITIPSNAYFVRFNITDGAPTALQRQFNFGEVALPYEVYVQPTLRENIKVEKDNAWVFGTSNLANKSVTLDKIDFAEGSTNLFNSDTATAGFAILNDGSVSPNASYSYSDYIAVLPNEKYTMTAKDAGGIVQNAFINVAFYGVNKNFLSRIYSENKAQPNGALTITIPANAFYVRLNITDGAPSALQRQFNQGEVALPYEPYHDPRLFGVSLSDDIVEDISSRLEITKSDNVMTDIPVDGTFSTTQTWAAITNFMYTTAAQVYQMFDDLMALHPDYITKQALGNDGLGNPIALYKFTPKRPSSDIDTHYPKIFLTAGTHGFEHVSTLASYLMFEQMCNNWQSDELLEALRFNVDFLIIPVVNPSGWDAYTRTNHNNVDINRNFPDGWVLQGQGTPTYSGPSAASELETQYVMSVFDTHTDIDAMYDFHNFHGVANDPQWHRFIWIPSGSIPYVQHMGQMLISRMTRKWRKDYPTWFPSNPAFFAGWTSSDHGAMVQDHARGRGIKFSATFEVCERWWVDPNAVPYDTTHKRTATEAIVNWLLINLNELKRN